jgi:hypothetical protein
LHQVDFYVANQKLISPRHTEHGRAQHIALVAGVRGINAQREKIRSLQSAPLKKSLLANHTLLLPVKIGQLNLLGKTLKTEWY